MRSTTVALIAVLCCTAVFARDLDLLHEEVAKDHSGLFAVNLQTLILLPTDVVKQIGKVHNSQVDLESAHQVDAISAFVQEYESAGGEARNLDALVFDSDSRQQLKLRTLSFMSRTMSDLPWRFTRKGTDIVVLPYRSIEACIAKHNFGFGFATKAKEIEITYKDMTTTISKNEFDSDFAPFFTEACSLIELARNQGRTSQKNALIVELTSIGTLLKSRMSKDVGAIVKALLQKFEKTASSVFGAGAVANHVVSFTPGHPIRHSSARILQGVV